LSSQTSTASLNLTSTVNPSTASVNESVVETSSTLETTSVNQPQSLTHKTETSQSTSETVPSTEHETHAPAGDEGFLSFEDWKRLNLLQSSEINGESAEDSHSRQVREAPQPRDRPKDQALDSIGDEIDIQIETSPSGKTSKERFNYASFDCAAAVLKSNPEARGSSSILDENRDRYMLNKCSATNQFVIVEMCEDILVDTIVLANFEFFSSTFKNFRVSVTDRYPTIERGWKVLGIFTGSNSRSIQVFAVENPLIWARYVRIEFLSHYGTEFYCPLTLLRIHGTTMMEEYKNQENAKNDDYRHDHTVASSQEQEEANLSIEDIKFHSTQNISVSNTESSSSISLNESQSASQTVQSDQQLSAPTVEEVVLNTTSTNSTLPSIVPDTTSMPLQSSQVTVSNKTSNNNISTTTPDLSPGISNPHEVAIMPQETESATESLKASTAPTEKTESASSSVSPTTQESVYKTITKRLSLLEANATLSLRYIEEQSQILRDVFSKMERRHSQKVDSFIAELNSTLVTRLQFYVRHDSSAISNIIATTIRRPMAVNNCGTRESERCIP
jgi:Sad1 / UNC-like C-terminal